VHVDIEIERPTEPLNGGPSASARIDEAVRAGATAQVSRHLAEQRADDLLA
jgi:hypothetical protein